MQLTDNQILSYGSEIRKLLNGEPFLAAVEALRLSYAHTILTSSPQEKEKREDTYRRHAVLEDLLISLNTFTYRAEQLAFDNEDN